MGESNHRRDAESERGDSVPEGRRKEEAGFEIPCFYANGEVFQTTKELVPGFLDDNGVFVELELQANAEDQPGRT